MCGILAVLGCSDDSQAKRSHVLELSRRLKHRGPDWSGIYQHGDCYLSHQRLAIVDPDSGDQPLYNENKTIVVTVNGEIYNHEELRKRLSNHKFRTGSDCDVIAHLYEEHGENFIDMLDGVFSFVLLDTRDNSFIAARDAIGITPLYIGWGLDGSVWISSELKGLHDDCEHFEWFPPGHLYSSKSSSFRRWYNPPWFCEAIPSIPYDPLILRRAFENAVLKRLMTDVPFGVLLSGGLDSSLVASITSRHLAGTKIARQWGSQLHSFCVGLAGSPDLVAAREVAEVLGTVHHEYHFSVQIKALHLYDCLRANKATSAWGLEARVPFLDKEFINVVMSIDPEWKMIKPEEGRMEKWILRKAFDDEKQPYLPKHILYRQKKQFSDGVGYSWIDGLKAHVEQHVTDKMMHNAEHIFTHNTPTTKEAYYYRMIFDKFFPQSSAMLTVPGGPSVACSTAKAVEWDQAWSRNLDPSGRAALGIHDSAYERQPIGAKNTISTKIVDDIPQMTGVPASALAMNS
ncbi:asparagine synthetase [glutamine-hydrolyzing] isoform X3 [Beta vulgaris subsp. vulgaris]|uniref:asparagine synthetase [glutamine-hydrolyzing] isoform X3 n=1 Tax=Beta vulgaris subsp. vulgaris TaxID=3555 RepID=UPI0020374850|nr:asparagine synthetase [glutamine-hydrolyzing] isoform X3 [Beta vulgaris subsp. vulgaris]